MRHIVDMIFQGNFAHEGVLRASKQPAEQRNSFGMKISGIQQMPVITSNFAESMNIQSYDI